jgi:hypothetical protein
MWYNPRGSERFPKTNPQTNAKGGMSRRVILPQRGFDNASPPLLTTLIRPRRTVKRPAPDVGPGDSCNVMPTAGTIAVNGRGLLTAFGFPKGGIAGDVD